MLNFKTLDTGTERRLKLGKLRGLTANLWYFPQSFITATKNLNVLEFYRLAGSVPFAS